MDMKKVESYLLTMAVAMVMNVQAQVTPVSQMEKLGRGLIVLPAAKNGEFVSWRLLGTDDEDRTTFDVLRDGNVIKSDLAYVTNYTDNGGHSGSQYQVVTKVDGMAVDTTEAVTPWQNRFYQLHLERPEAGSDYTYAPGDCSVGDVDGDGEYELFVKWDPSNCADNSHNGMTGKVIIDCYKVDWTVGGTDFRAQKLWRVDLGVNIRAGAHYTQFLVYDFDGDGRAEMMCKTGPGSIDGNGNYVCQAGTDAKIRATDNSKDWRNGGGKIDGGYEFLTVFEGETGQALHTVFYKPNRSAQAGGSESAGTFNWDDRPGRSDYSGYGNRGERYLATVAYLDGADEPPCAVFTRGYYTYSYLWAVSFDGKELKDKWYHESFSTKQYRVTANGKINTYTAPPATNKTGGRTMFGNGNHNISVGDVDGDGCDEIVWGSAALDHDGKMLYATGYGHGDAIHMADHNPDRSGLEVFQIHEGTIYGWDFHDAATGEILFLGAVGGADNGRGIAGQFSSTHRGAYFSSAKDAQLRSAVTGMIDIPIGVPVNFRIYWDGDLQEEFFDAGRIEKLDGEKIRKLFIDGKNPYEYYSSSTCNGTKATPNLQADLFGDWREEIIMWNSSNASTLNIFTTNEETEYGVPTLMHDHLYRMGIAWQNVGYNQPPHLGYYLPDRFLPSIAFMDNGLTEQTIEWGDSIQPIELRYKNCTLATVDSTYHPDGVRKGLLGCFQRVTDYSAKRITLTGKPDAVGDYVVVVRAGGVSSGSKQVYARVVIHVVPPTHIEAVQTDKVSEGDGLVYDLQGRVVTSARLLDMYPIEKGIYIINGKKVIVDRVTR